MAAGTCVRVCLHFSDLDDETCWFLVDFKKMPSIECMQRVIGRKFYNKEEKPFKLTLKGSLLPAWESSCILRDDDQIIVQPETANSLSSTYWFKKRKRKKKSLINSKQNSFSPLKKSKSLESIETKNPDSFLVKDLVLTSEISLDNVSTPANISTLDVEIGNQKSCKKKKKKLDCTNYAPIEIEEIPAPKKAKISKSPKLEREFKKKAVTQETTPEVVEIEKHHKKIVTPEPNNNVENKVTISDQNDTDQNDAIQDLKDNTSELIKLDNIPANSNDILLMEVSDVPPPPPPLSYSKEVSIKIKDNSSEEITNLVELPDKNEMSLANLESSTKSKTSGLEKTLDPEKTYLQEDSSCSIDEHVEVYKIAKDDLDVICQSLKVGDSLTIDSDKVKAVDIENVSNSSSFESVDVNNDETKTHETSIPKQNKKGSGKKLRRSRRKRGQRSFACSPFIFSMNQGLYFGANKSSLSTPVANKGKNPVSSNSSQRHFYFESDGENDDEIDEEKNISEFEMFVDKDSKNNLQNSKGMLSSHQNVTNGAEDSNSSMVSQERDEEEKDKSLVSQKTPSKKSVHFASEDVFCESFDNSKQPIIYKRGNPLQRRNYPTLIRQQQLNTSFESCSSICKSVEDDSDVTPVNGSNTASKFTKEYSLLPGIVGYPRAGDKIAFKRLELGEDYSPRLSDFIEAKVISFQEDTKMLEMKVLSAPKTRKKDKFELIYEDDKDIMILEESNDMESVELCTLQEIKLLK